MTKILEILETDSNIEICTSCKGKGEVIDDSWGSGVSDYIKCDLCKGSGRIQTAKAICEIQIPFYQK